MLKKLKEILNERSERRSAAVPEVPAEIYRDIFTHAAVATALIDKDGKFFFINRKFEQLSGWSQEEIEDTLGWRDLVAPEDREKAVRYFGELEKSGGQASIAPCTLDLRDKTGRHLPIALSLRQVPETQLVIMSLTDNSVQKRLEEMLRANENRYRTLVENLPVGVYRSKLEQPGGFLWANAALVRMYGYDSLDELLKNPVLNSYANPEDRQRFIHELETAGSVRNFEVLQKKKDGSTFRVRVNAEPKKNREGTIEWVEGTVEDLTAERALSDAGLWKNRIGGTALDSTAGICICTTDCNGTLTFINRVAIQALGCTADELIGTKTPLVFHPESELTARSRILTEEAGRLITGFEIFSWPVAESGYDEREWTWVCRDKKTLSINLTVTAMITDSGEQAGYLFVAKEITEMKQLEEAFRHANLQMSGVIYNLPDATFAIDHEGRVIAWNRAMENITGVKAVDILGKGNFEYALSFYGSRRPMLIDLITAPDEKIQEWGFCSIKRKGNAVMAEAPTLDPSNTLRVLWCLASPIFDAEGNRMGAIESIADVTERRRRETALKDSVLKFREILDNIGAAMAIVEEDDTITYINPEFGRILGYVRDEIEGKKRWMEFVVPDDVRKLELEGERVLYKDEDQVRTEIRFIRWDGEVRTAFLVMTRIPQTQKLAVALMDITDKIRAENAVQQANRKLNFLTMVIRHDILNQLTVLKGNLELTREQNSDPGQAGIIAKELAATEAIQSLITFTRDYQDIGISPPEWQDVKQSVIRSCDGIRLGEIVLTVDIEGVEVYADRLLASVFSHLIENAIRHGEKTTRIRIFCQESFEELHIVCEDDGIGVPPEAKEKIFSRQFFSQTGLQMYLVQEILSITGIAIRETGIYGTGACFELRVPKGGYRFSTAQQ